MSHPADVLNSYPNKLNPLDLGDENVLTIFPTAIVLILFSVKPPKKMDEIAIGPLEETGLCL